MSHDVQPYANQLAAGLTEIVGRSVAVTLSSNGELLHAAWDGGGHWVDAVGLTEERIAGVLDLYRNGPFWLRS
jgi:hypothetical protein